MRTSCLYSSFLALCFIPNFQRWLWYPMAHHTQPKSHPYRGWTTVGKMSLVVLGNDADGTCRKSTVPNCLHLSVPRVPSVEHWWRYRGHKARTVFAREWFAPAQVSSDASEPAPLSQRSTHQIQSLSDQRINSVELNQNEPWDDEGGIVRRPEHFWLCLLWFL